MALRRRQQVQMNDGERNFELSDDDLEMVVGGLSPEASLAQARYLRDSSGDSAGGSGRGAQPNWLMPTPS